MCDKDSNFLITAALRDNLSALWALTVDTEWKEKMLERMRDDKKPLFDEVLKKFHRWMGKTIPEPLPFHILLLLDELEGEGLVKSIASLGHIENFLIEHPFFIEAFLAFRDRALDVVFQELDQSDIKCVVPFVGF